jgi:hypothetical protein
MQFNRQIHKQIASSPELQALASRRSLVYNAYDAMAVAAYLRASGRAPTYKLSWSDTTVTEDWTVL